jgi:hypothetical protein
MKSTVLRRLAALVLALAAIAVVGVLAYNFGVTHSFGSRPMMRGVPVRGFGEGSGYAPGIGLLGLLGFVLVGVLVFWLLTDRMSPRTGGPAPTAPEAPAAGDLERLRELSDLHTAGKLTDEEFTAAKRKLLGLQ